MKWYFRWGIMLGITAVIVTYVLLQYNQFLDRELDNIYEQTGGYNSSIAHTSGVRTLDNGVELIKRNAEQGNLLILGSSELTSPVPQNPKYMFPNQQLNCNVDLIGHASVQSLLDAIRVGGCSEALEDKKIVFVVSVQWFMGDELDRDGYKSNFSELQFYQLMNNNVVSNDMKQYVCERTARLTKNGKTLAGPYLYAYLYSKNNVVAQAFLACLKPYYFLREQFLLLKDKHDSVKLLKNMNNLQPTESRSIDWARAKDEAHGMGMVACANNNFYVNDAYYNEYLATRIDSLRNSSQNVELLKAKELDDYKAFLEICQQLNVQPYIIFMPTNGRYYDYIGVGKEKRQALYEKLETLAEQYGFAYLDMKEKEYEPYFMIDVMHLGWGGWLYVNEAITEHYGR